MPEPDFIPATTVEPGVDKEKKPDAVEVLMSIKRELDKFFREQEKQNQEFKEEIEGIKRHIETLQKAVSIPLTSSPSNKDDISGGDKDKKIIGEGGEKVTSPDADISKSVLNNQPRAIVTEEPGVFAVTGNNVKGSTTDIMHIIQKGLTNEDLIRIERELIRMRGVVYPR